MDTFTVLRPVDPKWRISCPYGKITKGMRDGKPHKGVDFACPAGTPVRACFDGVVALLRTKDEPVGDSPEAERMRRGGNRVGLYNQHHRALYMHLDDFLAKLGQKVRKGDILGFSGNTGHSTGPHLHFELRLLASDLPILPAFEESYYA